MLIFQRIFVVLKFYIRICTYCIVNSIVISIQRKGKKRGVPWENRDDIEVERKKRKEEEEKQKKRDEEERIRREAAERQRKEEMERKKMEELQMRQRIEEGRRNWKKWKD